MKGIKREKKVEGKREQNKWREERSGKDRDEVKRRWTRKRKKK